MKIGKTILQKKHFTTFFIIIITLSFLGRAYSDENLYNDVRKQLWLSGFSVVKASYSWQEAVQFINNDPKAIKEWASDTTPHVFCSLVYSAPWGRIWTMGFFYSLNALFVRDILIPTFQENDFVLIPFWGEVSESGELHKALLQKSQFPQNFYFLGNSDQCTNVLRAESVQAFTVSHNAFIDHNHFRPLNNQRQYSAVYAGSCRSQKRLNLASSVLSDLLVVTDSDAETRKPVANAKTIVLNPHISLIPHYLNQASCGLILSKAEGGCYASTEYLYCGIPVVSTKSIGGRDAYYDEITAIIVDDTPEAVQNGVEIMRQRNSDPWEIRRRALMVTEKMLNTLAFEILGPIFERYNDPHAKDPRNFINMKLNESKNSNSKGRTVFQPENPTHNTIQKVINEQNKYKTSLFEIQKFKIAS